MILFINTTPKDYFELILASKPTEFKVKKVSGNRNQAEKLMPTIDKFLSAQKIKPEKLRGLGVISGPGGFTSVRIGVAAANALGYALHLPVVAIRADEFNDNKELAVKIYGLINKIGANKKYKIVEPYYNREPNITMTKKK